MSEPTTFDRALLETVADELRGENCASIADAIRQALARVDELEKRVGEPDMNARLALELDVIGVISRALSSLKSDESRERVLRYVCNAWRN